MIVIARLLAIKNTDSRKVEPNDAKTQPATTEPPTTTLTKQLSLLPSLCVMWRKIANTEEMNRLQQH